MQPFNFLQTDLSSASTGPKTLMMKLKLSQYPESERRINQLGQLNIPTRQGLMPLSSFVEIIPKFDVPSIRRVDMERERLLSQQIILKMPYPPW